MARASTLGESQVSGQGRSRLTDAESSIRAKDAAKPPPGQAADEAGAMPWRVGQP
jgi:hypothetical protein